MYVSFYNLTGRPFQLSPDPRFFFESRRHRKVMAYLNHGLSEGSGFIVLTGEVGTGKTTIVGHLLNQLDREKFIFARIVTSRVDADDALRMVASAFRLPFEGADKATLIRSIEAFLIECHRQGKRPLLVVDEAQNMPAAALEELRMLTNFQREHRPLLQCVFVGHPQFRALLAQDDMEQLQQRVVASCHLKPMEEDETRDYIVHRLSLVGWKGDPELAEGTVEAIHRYSGGIPRRINALCGRLLLFGYLEELHQIDEQVVTQIVQELEDETGQFGAADSFDGPVSQPAAPRRAAGPMPVESKPEDPPAPDDAADPAPDSQDEALDALARRVASLKRL